MTSSIVDWWRQLEGTVHPADQAVFDEASGRHSFNIDYPPPAYIGNVDGARVLILVSNGGYDPEFTPMEFAGNDKADQFRELLRNPRSVNLDFLAPYYNTANYADLIKSGEVCLVNAVPYRSPRLSDEPDNQKLARHLPSTAIHHNWLHSEILPAAKRGEKFVVCHRGREYWDIRHSSSLPNVILSRAPLSKSISKQDLKVVRDWLSEWDYENPFRDLLEKNEFIAALARRQNVSLLVDLRSEWIEDAVARGEMKQEDGSAESLNTQAWVSCLITTAMRKWPVVCPLRSGPP